MQKRMAALMMTASIIAGSLLGCGSTATTSYASETIYGQVTAVSDTGFTMTVGQYDEESGDMTLSDETAEITVTDDTTYTMGGGGQAPSGEAPGQPGDESSDGSSDSDTSSDQAPSGDKPSDSGQAPSGDKPSDNGQAPSGDKPSDNGQAPSGDAPEKPDGDSGNAPADGQEPPAKPDDATSETSDETETTKDSSDESSEDTTEASTDEESSDQASSDASDQPAGDGQAPEGGQPGQLGLSSISEGTEVAVTFDADGKVESVEILSGMESAMGGPGGGSMSAADITYTAMYEYNEDTDVSGQTIDSTGTDESAILVTEGNTSVTDSTITRTSDDSTGGDNSSFYGVGATLLTTGGTLTVENIDITSDAKGAAGVFAYGDGVAYVNNCTITTTQDTSGGIHVAGGGTLYANNNTVTTNGESSAAIRSDRGGGTMLVDGGTYTSNGTGSPAVYCTADLTISNATLTANGSEAVCIEGLNSLKLIDCDLTGNIPTNEQNDCDWNIILYQSMSGDSEVGNSTFSMTGGSITAKNGGMFYTTNTESTFYLENVDMTYTDDNDFFLKCTGNANQRGWGSTGSNGANCTFTAVNQEMEGDVIWDSISTLDMEMKDGSVLTGAFIDDESCAGNGGDGYANLTIGSGCKWVVTGDSLLSSLTNNGTIVDAQGNTVTIVGTDGTTYVEGNSSYTITVESYN